MQILINGNEVFFDESEAIADLDSVARQFTFVDVNDAQRFEIGDMVEVFDDKGILFIKAPIEYLEAPLDDEKSEFVYAGRNKAKEIVDGYASKTTQFSKGQKLNTVLSEIATPFGIKVFGDANLPKQDIKTILIGEKYIDAFLEIVQSAGKIITSDAKGNLLIEFDATGESDLIIEFGTNILSRSFINDTTQIYDKYIVVSQSNYLFNQQQDVNVQGSFGSGNREKVEVVKNTLTINECEKLAEIQQKKDIRKSLNYTVKTNNIHYDLNTKYFVKDVKLNINEKMNCKLIKLVQKENEFYTLAGFEKVVA